MIVKNLIGSGEQTFQRNFSKIGKYQDEFSITYNVNCDKNSCVITVCESEHGQIKKRSSKMEVDIPKKDGFMLLQLLYENAVQFSQWQDVIKDLLNY